MKRSLAVVIVGGFGLTLLLATLGACDSQVSSDYRGESLLTLSGSVDIGDSMIDGPLVPAMVFGTDVEHDELYVVDVAVEGEFPASFTMRAYEPPPPEAFQKLSAPVGEPRVAVAHITALPVDHDPVIVAARWDWGVQGPHEDGGFLVASFWSLANQVDRLRDSYVEWWRCDADRFDASTCAFLEAEGNAAWKDDPWDRLAGVSENIRVIYLERDAPGHTSIAHRLGAHGRPLSRGYHVVSVRAATEAERDAAKMSRCDNDAERLALERLRTRLGSTVDEQTLWDSHHEELVAMIALAEAEFDCDNEAFVATIIDDPQNADIAVRLGQADLLDKPYAWP